MVRSIPSSRSGSGGRSVRAARPRSGWSARSTCCSGSWARGLARNACAARSSALAMAAPSRATKARAPASKPTAAATWAGGPGRPPRCSSSAARASALAVSASVHAAARRTNTLRSSTARMAICFVCGSQVLRPSRMPRATAFHAGGCPGDGGLARHQRAAPQRARQPYELVGRERRVSASPRPDARDTPPPRGRRSRTSRAVYRAPSWERT